MILYLASRVSTLPLYQENENMAPLHVATLTVKRELPKYDIIFSILYQENENMVPLHVATLTVQRELPKYDIICSI